MHDLRRLCDNIGPGKKLSSAVFDNDGEWYLQLYPSGYHGNTKTNSVDTEPDQKFLSLYLHSSPKQVELGRVMKQRFRLGLKKFNPGETDLFNPKGYDGVWFPSKEFVCNLHPKNPDAAGIKAPIHQGCDPHPWGSACMALFNVKNRVFGKRYFAPLSIFTVGRDEHKLYPPLPVVINEATGQQEEMWQPDDNTQRKEFVAGDWNKGGSVCFVMEMLVTDEISFQSAHMLHYTPAFGAPPDNQCNETNQDISAGKVVCYECGKGYSKEATTYQARMEEYGYEIGREYILDILMREEEHWVDSIMKHLNMSDHINKAVKSFTKTIASWRLALKNPETGNEDLQQEEEEADDVDDDDDEPIKNPTQQQLKKMQKEKLLQEEFENKMAELRKDVEDAHFSKPVCAKCFAARQKLTHPSTTVLFANEPARWGKMRSYKAADEANKGPVEVKVSKKVRSGPMYIDTPKQVPSKWECPDQNEITAFGVQESHKINLRNACVDMLDYSLALWDFGTVDSSKTKKKVGEKLSPLVMATIDPPIPNFPSPDEVLETLTWCGNFRYNWKNKLKLMEDKYEALDGIKTLDGKPDGVFKKVQWSGGAETRTFHTIPLPAPPASVTAVDPEAKRKYEKRWSALNGDGVAVEGGAGTSFTGVTNARVAMTLVRDTVSSTLMQTLPSIVSHCCGPSTLTCCSDRCVGTCGWNRWS